MSFSIKKIPWVYYTMDNYIWLYLNLYLNPKNAFNHQLSRRLTKCRVLLRVGLTTLKPYMSFYAYLSYCKYDFRLTLDKYFRLTGILLQGFQVMFRPFDCILFLPVASLEGVTTPTFLSRCQIFIKLSDFWLMLVVILNNFVGFSANFDGYFSK